MSKWLRRQKAPTGFERVQCVLDELDRELREKMNEPHEGKRKCESLWPVHQINWQKSRFVYDMYYTYGRISRQVYEFCLQNKLVDANLIAKWKKPGYERLCSTFAINPKNYNYGTVSICRVPKHQLSEHQVIQEKHSGCRGCASGTGGYYNIFGNKYGQYLAKIQVFREQQAKQNGEELREDSYYGVSIWATKEEEDAIFEQEQRERGLNGETEKEAGDQQGHDATKNELAKNQESSVNDEETKEQDDDEEEDKSKEVGRNGVATGSTEEENEEEQEAGEAEESEPQQKKQRKQ